MLDYSGSTGIKQPVVRALKLLCMYYQCCLALQQRMIVQQHLCDMCHIGYSAEKQADMLVICYADGHVTNSQSLPVAVSWQSFL